MAANDPTAPTPPSTYIIGVGTLIMGSAAVTFEAGIGLSEHAQVAIVSFGGFLVAVGTWLHTIGH
jgi:hypothetical protein